MSKRYSARLFHRVLVPVIHGIDAQAAIQAATLITDAANVLLVGIVVIQEGESLSAAALPARHVRKVLGALSTQFHVRVLPGIRAAYRSWEEVVEAVHEERVDLLVLDPGHVSLLNAQDEQALSHPPCDIVIAGGNITMRPANILVSLRGGPYAELSLRLGLSIARTCRGRVTALHVSPAGSTQGTDPAFKGVDKVLRNLPEVRRRQIKTDDPAQAILDAASESDLVVMGATGHRKDPAMLMGPVAEKVLKDSSKGVLLVKSRRPLPANMESEVAGQNAISVLVDKWFAENTYHAGEFADLDHLLKAKQEQNLRVSLALPALNEEETVGKVIRTVKDAMMVRIPLLDEIVLVDSDSSDRTREIAAGLDIPVHIHQQVLPAMGTRAGKGEALWKSLYLTCGDIVVWIDTDIANIHPRFVYGLLGPLILHPEVQFVKGFYRRPLKVDNKLQAGGGGRVTELTARPLLNLFFPELSGIIQPLSGEYGGRRTALEQMPFSSGYGVEIGLLIDMFEKFGLRAIAQVDLQERIHHNQPLESLSKMSFAIIQTVVRRIEKRYGTKLLEDVNKTMKMIRYGQQRLVLDVEEIAEQERPPMMDVPEYREIFPEVAP
ncbi:MAG TPA: glucosyl-3-phosphoglycerate synthase [Anaerolineales bacterium]|nr:glucosyl-3-phosphoglycerate synthase [Anaerolineales bacterium]